MGIPPFGGFFAKLLIILGAMQIKNYFVAFLIVGTAILTLIYLMRVWTKVFNGEEVTHPGKPEARKLMPVVVVIFAVLSLISFVVLIYPFNIVGKAVAVTVSQMVGLR